MPQGTGTILSVGTNVTGVGTGFTSELVVGSMITGDTNGETLVVASIEDDLELTLIPWGPTNEFVDEGFTYAAP